MDDEEQNDESEIDKQLKAMKAKVSEEESVISNDE